MKISIFKLAIAGVFITSLLTGYDSIAQNQHESNDKIKEDKKMSRQEKKAVEQEELQAAEREEYNAFMKESGEKIQANEMRIAELREKKKQDDLAADQEHEKRIGNLQEKNDELKMRRNNYKPGKSMWVKFKEEFNHDINELGNAFKDVGVNNKK